MLLQILNKEKGAKISHCKIRAKKHFCHLILLKMDCLEQENRVVVFFFFSPSHTMNIHWLHKWSLHLSSLNFIIFFPFQSAKCMLNSLGYSGANYII